MSSFRKVFFLHSRKRNYILLSVISLSFIFTSGVTLDAQPLYHPGITDTVRLNTHWFAKKADQISLDGTQLTNKKFKPDHWLPAVVPGTILTTLLYNHYYSNPNIGFNNKKIPDIATIGNQFYTYWYYTTFRSPVKGSDKHIWLHFRGINYSAQVFLNGKRINKDIHHGMFLREQYDITHYLRKDTLNQLAVLVSPPNPPGVANGGQAGNGIIGKSVTNQYVAGWDWIAPVHDRNTGIWDKVFLTRTGPVQIRSPFVRPVVPGVRQPGIQQTPAYLKTSLRIYNADKESHNGIIQVKVDDVLVTQSYHIASHQIKTIKLPKLKIEHPKLWWPNGLGKHPLYPVLFTVKTSRSKISDFATVQTGIRQITYHKDPVLKGQIFKVNGQPVFIRGGNWIASDWMLRLSKDRYDAEIHYMADMHLNMIRVWGGGITERPDFYNACDRNGILVMQDLWITGDADGAWHDPKKKDSKERRRFYPDNHSLFLKSAVDQIKMLRNHPSLCFWSGGNEIAPAPDINRALAKHIIPKFDPDRLYVSHSTAQKLYTHSAKVRADGPYNIQVPDSFFTRRSRPFNPEVGSVGLPVASTLHRIFPHNDSIPNGRGFVPAVWRYHKYLPYTGRNGKDYIRQYGTVHNVDTYARYAQLVNYNQYRALFEGWNAHMWKWYSGVLIWKLQNPWTALRGQFYDWFLHPNGCMYGLMHGAEPIHIQYDPVSKEVQVINNKFRNFPGAHVSATWYNIKGKAIHAGSQIINIPANKEQGIFSLKQPNVTDNVYFLNLILKDRKGDVLSRNFYWLHKQGTDYQDLHKLRDARIQAIAKISRSKETTLFSVTLSNEEKRNHGPVAFWIRLKLKNPKTGSLIAPVFYSDNYISLTPGERRTIHIRINNRDMMKNHLPDLELSGWNVKKMKISIKR